MAKDRDKMFRDFITPNLEEGEEIIYAAFGVKQPNMGLIILLMVVLALLPGMLVVQAMTKNYIVALTNRRLLVIQTNQRFNVVKAIMSYDPMNLGGELKTSTGAIFTHIAISNESQPFKAKFHRAGSKMNREQAMGIAAALSNPTPTPAPSAVPTPTAAPTSTEPKAEPTAPAPTAIPPTSTDSTT